MSLKQIMTKLLGGTALSAKEKPDCGMQDETWWAEQRIREERKRARACYQPGIPTEPPGDRIRDPARGAPRLDLCTLARGEAHATADGDPITIMGPHGGGRRTP